MEDDDTYSLEKALNSLTDLPAEEESNLEEQSPHNHESQLGIVETAQIKSSKIHSLRSQEKTLLRIDRLLVSGGIRFVLFLPLIVIVNFGLAHS